MYMRPRLIVRLYVPSFTNVPCPFTTDMHPSGRAYVSDDGATVVVVLQHLHAQAKRPRHVVADEVSRPAVAVLATDRIRAVACREKRVKQPAASGFIDVIRAGHTVFVPC